MNFQDGKIEDDLLPADEARIELGDNPMDWRPKKRTLGQRLLRFRMVGAWCFLALMGGSLLWLLSWLQPQPAVRLSLLGAPYQENLSVPHNVYGWRWLEDMAQFTVVSNEQTIYSRNTWHMPHGPTLLSQESKWDAGWDDINEPVFVACFSAHGFSSIANKENADSEPVAEAFLLPNECDPADSSNWIRVKDILSRLKGMPKDQKKLIVFDTVHFDTSWRYGVLHNHFSRSLRQLNDEIEAIPNLVVLVGSDVDQKSWNCVARQRTVFGHFLMQGIRGQAVDENRDGRVDAWDLFQFTNQHTHQWVKVNRNAKQNVLLLPMGKVGQDRAGKIDLGIVKGDYQTQSVKLPPLEDYDEIRIAWEGYQEFKNADKNPVEDSPGLWREYEKSLLRFEQLIDAGERLAANSIRERLEVLRSKLQWQSQSPVAADQGDLFVGDSMSGYQTNNAEAQAMVNSIWSKPADQWHAFWKNTLTKYREDSVAEGRFRLAVLRLLYERAQKDPLHSLAKSAAISRVVTDPLVPAPVEINFLQMLDRFFPENQRTLDEADRLSTALSIRLMAEKAVVAFESSDGSACDEILPWIVEQVSSGDMQRRMGEDLLFADKNDRKKADRHFLTARRQYQLAIHQSENVATAIQIRNQVFANAPHFAVWISELSRTESNASSIPLLDRFENLMRDTHKLAKRLQVSQVDSDSNFYISTQQKQDLASQVDRVKTELAFLKSEFEQWCKLQFDTASRVSETDLREPGKILAIPFGKPEFRIALIQKTIRSAHGRVPQVQSPTTMSESKSRSSISSKTHSKNSIGRASVQGRLVLALIGKRMFDELGDESQTTCIEDFEQSLHRIQVLSADEKWWRSLSIVGRQVATRMNAGPLNEDQRNADSASEALQVKTGDIWQRQQLEALKNRQFGGIDARAPEVCPNSIVRKSRQSRFFVELARRTERDHWFDDNPSQPYYKRASLHFLQTAANLLTELAPKREQKTKSFATLIVDEIDRAKKRIETTKEIGILAPHRIDLTTEKQLPFQIGIDGHPGKQKLDGYALLWVESEKDLVFARPTSGRRLIKKLSDTEGPGLETCMLTNPLELPELDRPSQPAAVPAISVSSKPGNTARDSAQSIDPNQQISVCGFFRGRRFSKNVDVMLHARPTFSVGSFQRPREALLSVRASRELNGIYGKASGAVAFVIDCSGSMGSQRGKPYDSSAKYHEALRALETVLKQMPDGVQVSVWVFGQALGPQKTVRNAETTIRRMIAPTQWNRQDRGQIESIMQRLKYPNVEPWNESPLIETILAAKQDLQGQSGFKTVLAITDGVDNRFQFSPNNSQNVSVENAIRKSFDKSDVALNIVGFKIEDQEQRRARKQFKVIEGLTPPGKYFEVKDSANLADVLGTALHQRVRYWVDDLESDESNGPTKMDVAGSDDQDKWYPHSLASGSYSLWNDHDSEPAQVIVENGNRLVLQYLQIDGKLNCQRLPFLKTDYPWKPVKNVGDWSAVALENRIDQTNKLQLLIAFEKRPETNPTAVAQYEPDDIWFDVTDRDGRSSPAGLKSQRVYGFPVPTWKLEIENWPIDPQSHRPIPPVVNVWYNPNRRQPPSAVLTRGRDYQDLSQLLGRTIDIDGVSIQLNDIQVEHRRVETSPGQFELQPCLVVRAQSKKRFVNTNRDLDSKDNVSTQQRIRIRPTGCEFEGFQELYYGDVGKFTGIYWPIVTGEVDRSITGFDLTSITELKQDSVARGDVIQMDNLRTPSPDDVVSPPLVGQRR